MFIILLLGLFGAVNSAIFENGTSDLNVYSAEYIYPCYKRDPKLDKCLLKSFNHFKKYLIQGIPELDLPPLEPFNIPKLSVENNHGPFRVKALFHNMTVYGISNFSLNTVRSDIWKWRIDFGITLPNVIATGRYDVNGNVFLLPIRSRGEFWTSFSDLRALAKIQGAEIVKNNVSYLQMDKLNVDFTLKNPRFKVTSKQRGSNVLDDAINSFLNTNGDVLVNEVKDTAASSVEKFLKGLVNKAFAKVPISAYLKEPDSTAEVQEQRTQRSHIYSIL